MKRKFIIQEVVACPACAGTGVKDGWMCRACKGEKTVAVAVSLEDALKEYSVDVPNTGYFGIIVPKA